MKLACSLIKIEKISLLRYHLPSISSNALPYFVEKLLHSAAAVPAADCLETVAGDLAHCSRLRLEVFAPELRPI